MVRPKCTSQHKDHSFDDADADADDDGDEKLATPTNDAMSGLPLSTPSPMPPHAPVDNMIKASTPATLQVPD